MKHGRLVKVFLKVGVGGKPSFHNAILDKSWAKEQSHSFILGVHLSINVMASSEEEWQSFNRELYFSRKKH